MLPCRTLAIAFLLTAPTLLAKLVLKDGKLALISSVGSTTLSTSFTSESPSPAPPTTVSSGDTLKLSFIVELEESGEGVQPQQAMILWQSTVEQERRTSGRDYLSVVKVRKGGKGKWELDFSRASTSLLSISSSPITATLLLGSPKQRGVKVPLGTFTLASNLVLPFPYPPDSELPAAWEVERYKVMPEIEWTFKEKETPIRAPFAIVGLLAVLCPWVVLLECARRLNPSFNSPTVNIVSFLVCIVTFETLIVSYWVMLKLIPTLPYFGALGVLTAWTGRRALGDLKRRRVARELGDKKSE